MVVNNNVNEDNNSQLSRHLMLSPTNSVRRSLFDENNSHFSILNSDKSDTNKKRKFFYEKGYLGKDLNFKNPDTVACNKNFPNFLC